MHVIRLKVKELAQEKGISQGLLSRTANIDLNTVRRLFRNPDAVVTTVTLDRLAGALGCHVCDLLDYIPDKKP